MAVSAALATTKFIPPVTFPVNAAEGSIVAFNRPLLVALSRPVIGGSPVAGGAVGPCLALRLIFGVMPTSPPTPAVIPIETGPKPMLNTGNENVGPIVKGISYVSSAPIIWLQNRLRLK